MKLKYILIFSAAVLLLAACEETVKLDIKQTPPKVVIEGLLTNQPGRQSVKLSWSVDFYASGQAPRITDAVVTVTDDLGEEISFEHNPRNHPDSSGVYVPASQFAGTIGRTYTLHVAADGKMFEATDKLLPVTKMDSLGYRLDEDENDDPKIDGKVYELLMYTKEPQDETNFYLFKFYRNDSLTVYSENEIYYSDDKFLAENINGVSSPVYYALNDKARVEMYSISRVGYVFYNDLSSLLTNDGGGMFGTIPAMPRTNLSNGAIGFFQVSALDSIEIQLGE